MSPPVGSIRPDVGLRTKGRWPVTSYEKWAVLTAVITVFVNAGLFIAFGFQLRLMRVQLQQASDATDRDHRQRRMQATLEFVTATFDRMGSLRDRGLPELVRAAVEPYTDRPLDMADKRNLLVREYLNGFEAFATGVNLGLYDIDVVNRLRGTMIIRSWALYEPWVTARRSLFSQASYYAELERLASDLSQLRRAGGQPDVEVV